MKTPDRQQSSAALGVMCAIGAATIFSTGGILVRHIDLPAWDVSFWRAVLLVATILPLLVWQRRAVWIDLRNAGLSLLASAVTMAGSMLAFILALAHAPVANVLIMFGATPFITALLARLFLGEPLHRHTLVAIASASAGLMMSVAGSLKAGAVLGMAIAFIVVLCMSSNYVVVRHRRDVGMAPALLLAGVIAALVALPFAHPETVEARHVPWLLALGPGQLLYMASLKRIPAGRAALLGLLELVTGADLGVGDRRRKAGRPHALGRRHRHRFRSGKCVAGFAPARSLERISSGCNQSRTKYAFETAALRATRFRSNGTACGSI